MPSEHLLSRVHLILLRRLLVLLSVLVLLLVPATLVRAQTPAAVAAAAATITPAALARHDRVLAADSFQRRGTPSPALERTARYVADQFARLGLRPAGDPVRAHDSTGQIYRAANGEWAVDSTWFQRYPIPGRHQLDYAGSRLRLQVKLNHRGRPIVNEHGKPGYKNVDIDFRTAGRFMPEVMPHLGLDNSSWANARAVTLLGGGHALASVRQANLHDRVVVYVLPPGGDSAEQRQVLAHLAAAGNHLVLLGDDDATGFAQRRAAALAHPPVLVDAYLSKLAEARPWAVEVRPQAAQPALSAAGLDWAVLRAARAPRVWPLPFTQAELHVAAAALDSTLPDVTAPNVVGLLPGTDEQLRGLCVVLSAPMDDGGGAAVAPGGELAGLLALAQAFSQPGLRPRYSLLFLATSGSGPGLWGSQTFLQNVRSGAVAHLGLERLGRGAGDSVWIAGLGDLDFAVSPTWTLSRHPELGLTVAEDEGSGERPTNHDAFARYGVASLALRGGAAGPAPVSGTGAVDPLDAVALDYAARVVRAAWYVGWDLATAHQPPRKTAAGRRRFLRRGTP